MNLNDRAAARMVTILEQAELLRVAEHPITGGGRVIDCGLDVPGGLQAGLELARICLADLADVTILPGTVGERPCPLVQVFTDHPVAACLASQYAGWQLAEGSFFAMGSGPMRAASGKEAIFDRIGCRETPQQVVGVLEGRQFPPPEIVARVAEACRVSPAGVTFLIAPTASLAAGVQVVARSIETAMHKLVDLGFDLSRIVAAHGSAPLPPVAKNDLAAIGRTNDSVLYGARVILYVRGDDESLRRIGPNVPSSSSRDFGEPFARIFKRYNYDFYAVDPHLFSPAEILFSNVESGESHQFGQVADDLLMRSFFE